jgi:hypothetical protein
MFHGYCSQSTENSDTYAIGCTISIMYMEMLGFKMSCFLFQRKKMSGCHLYNGQVLRMHGQIATVMWQMPLCF